MAAKRFKRKYILICVVLMASVVVGVLSWQPDSWLRRQVDQWQRQNNYDAYLTRHIRNYLSKEHDFPGLGRSGHSSDCLTLGFAHIAPRPGNYLYQEWDYVCVVSIDRRFRFAYRPWNTDLLYEYFAYEERGVIIDITRDPDAWYAERQRIYPCVPRSDLSSGSELTISIMKAQSELDGSIRPIIDGHGCANFNDHELVCEFSVPISDLFESP